MNNEKLEAGLASDLNRELEAFKFAALAAGYSIEFKSTGHAVLPRIKTFLDFSEWWMPKTDNGDALKLMADLKLDIVFTAIDVSASSFFHQFGRAEPFVKAFNGLGRDAATREVIFLCAVDIGKRTSV